MCDFAGGTKACSQAICNYGGLDPVTLKGVLVASDSFFLSANKEGFYLADPAGGAYSGVMLSVDTEWNLALTKGQLYDVEVRHSEAFCNTQLELPTPSAATMVGPGTAAAPATVAAADLIAGGAAAEQWEGVLVSVAVGSTVSSTGGGNTVELASGLVLKDDLGAWFSGSWNPPPAGTEIVSVVGFVRQPFNSVGSYQLVPASADHVVLGEVPVNTVSIEELQTAAASTSCPAPSGCDGSGNFCTIQGSVTVAGAVAISDVFTVSAGSNLFGFYVSQEAGTNRSILVVYDKDDMELPAGVVKGATLTTITGELNEIFCVTQIEPQSMSDVVVGGSGTIPAPTAVGSWAEVGEDHESVQVELTGTFTVTEVNAGDERLTVSDGASSFNISNTFDIFTGGLPTVGSAYTKLVGIVRFFRSDPNSNYYLAPTTLSDLTEQ